MEQVEKRLDHWLKLTAELASLKKQELELRKELFDEVFPDLTEGSATIDLPDGRKLTGQGKLSRRIDETALGTLWGAVVEVGAEKVFVVKPSLATAEYRKLTAEQLKIVNKAIVTTTGTPSLKVT